MPKKNNRKKPRKRPLNANPKRQAHAQLKGYLYQIWHSVDAWLDLADDETLYLEGAEDFDKVSGDDATATQVKHVQHSISLRSPDVIDAINNFWELQTNNSDRRVKYRFLTKSEISKEQGNPFGTDKSGIEVWRRCSGDEAAIKKISEFLQTDGKISAEVNDFLKKASPQEIYEHLIEPIAWETDSKNINFVEQSIIEKLVYHGDRQGVSPSNAKKVFAPLVEEAWKIATRKENRKLTRMHLLEIFENHTRVSVPIRDIQTQQPIDLTVVLDHIKKELIDSSSDIAIQFQSLIQTEIPQTYLDVLVPRTDLLTSIQTKLQSDSVVVLHGGTGRGKTTLAKLIANDIDGSWFWVNFTNREPSEVVQLLQQLAIAISSESTQVNVVLDDLNLQPQQLQAYKEGLGVVIYRVLERGAKILITSQHKPRNNFIRSLGLSSSMVINVPNFSIPEIEQFAEKMGCPAENAKTWSGLIQAHTGGHPRLVHAWLVRLREEGWKEQNILASILQTPQEVKDEREAARQLVTNLPKNQREFLYRLSLINTGFRKDYALNIGEIPEPITHQGDIFSQLTGPWIDQVDETYYTISPLLSNAAKEVWPESKIKSLYAQIANAILKTKKLTTIEAWTVFTHSMLGQYKVGIMTVIYSLMNAPQDDWQNICQEFSLLAHVNTNPPKELFPGDAFVNQMFRSLQYRIAIEVEPELTPKILETWDKETKPYEPWQSYLLSRLMLATQALRYNQVLLPAKKIIDYFKEMIDIKDKDKEVWQKYLDSMGQVEEYVTDKSNYFSYLFSFIYTRGCINAVFLDELIDALDELEPRIRTLLLAEFEDYNIDCRIMIENIYLQEEKLENPDWTRCLQVYDKVIEKTIEWGYPHIAAASSRGKAVIHDEYLKDHNTAHQVYQDIIFKVGALPVIEEGQAVVYIHHGHYQEALDIYERILPEWYKASERFGVGPLEEYRRAAICAAYLDDWKKAACFFEEGANKTQKIENTERYIGLYADAGFAHFKAGNMLNCIKLLHLALQNFETLPQDNTDVKYFTLKKRLEYIIKWIWMIWCGLENNSSELSEPSVGFCSDPETKEEFLTLPDCLIGYSWHFLAQIEYRFGHETTVFQHALQITDREEYPNLNFSISFLEAKYEFKNKTFDNLPQRILQLAPVYSSVKKHQQKGRGVGEKGTYSISNSDLSDFASVENITIFFVSALLTQLSTNRDLHEMLSVWRTNSLELPIKENIFIVLDLIESILLGDYNQALTVMKTENTKREKQLAAALKVVLNKETSLENLFYAHTFIASSLFDHTWLDPVVIDFGKLLSAQWLEKIKTGEMLPMNINIVQQIEQACNSSEVGKKKIGHILLAAYPVVKTMVDPQTLQKFRTWTESESKQKQGHAIGKNPAAQRLIKAMEKPPHLTDEDIEVLNQSIEEGKVPVKFDSPFEPDEHETNE